MNEFVSVLFKSPGNGCNVIFGIIRVLFVNVGTYTSSVVLVYLKE